MPRILIAEEDLQLRQLFSRVLRKNGYMVKEVGNGREGAEAAREGFDLVISDVLMPVMNGFEMIRQIRREGSSVPVLFITAKEIFDEMRQGFLSGRCEYLIKPVDLGELIQRIGEILNRARSMTAHSLSLGSTVLESDGRTVTADGKTEVLPETEFRLLYRMAASPGRIFTCRQLQEDTHSGDSHTVEQCLERLRERFCGSRDLRIVTMRGIGSKVAPLSAADSAGQRV